MREWRKMKFIHMHVCRALRRYMFYNIERENNNIDLTLPEKERERERERERETQLKQRTFER